MVETAVMLIPLCPLAACLITACLGPRVLKGNSHWPAILGCGAAFVLSVVAALGTVNPNFPQAGRTVELYRWLSLEGMSRIPPFEVTLSLRLDSLSATMLLMVTFVATLVAIYASGYMHGDSGYPRFFTEVSLFVFSMTMLVLAGNFLQLFVFWEAVGLCSYLLIGYWYEKPEASAAGMKAFLVNRVGDFGFVIGIFLVWITFHSFDYDDVLFHPAALSQEYHNNPIIIWLMTLCLFAGAVGKSAQFPLHVWLPDAMEGPTPVSALIHAATMVTAGVYMVARCTPLFMLAPQTQLLVAVIGGFTALLAALIALTQNDLKRVMAYSTVSQLGYMFLGLGTGSLAGVAGAMFHLVTHAFFKALLFLGAGSVMHAMGGVVDMRRFGGLRKVLPTTYWTFVVGALALSGLPPLSGFWSKDTILSAVHHAASAEHASSGPTAHPIAEGAHDGTPSEPANGERHTVRIARAPVEPATLLGYPAVTWYTILFWSASFTAFLTAFYTFRAVFLTFHGEERIPEEAGHHAHESPPSMTIPLMILAFGAMVLGATLGHLTGWFDRYLDRTIPGVGHPHEVDMFVAVLSLAVAVGGIALAYVMYGKPSTLPAKAAAAFGPLTRWSRHKFYFDEAYQACLVLPLWAAAQVSRFLDWFLVDGGFIGLFSRLPFDLGKLVRPLQNGLVQFYALSMMLALAVLLWAVLFRPDL